MALEQRAPAVDARRLLEELLDLYAYAAEVAFGWAEIKRREGPNPEMGDAPIGYVEGHPGTHHLAQQPGSPLHSVGLEFASMGKSAEEWEATGYRLTRAHDHLATMLEGRPQPDGDST